MFATATATATAAAEAAKLLHPHALAVAPTTSSLLPSPSSANGCSSKGSSPRRLPPASRIFVRNLPHYTGEATLVKLFSKFGRIVEVKLAKHEEMKKSKGYAFIQYTSQDDAVTALEQLDQKVLRIEGRIIYAEIAKPLNNGFDEYPISLGPPLQVNSDTTGVDDQLHPGECSSSIPTQHDS